MGEVQWFKQQQVILCCYKTLGFLSCLWQPSTVACTYPKAFKSHLLLTVPHPCPYCPGEAVQVSICLPFSSFSRCHEAKSYQSSWVTCRSWLHWFSSPFWCPWQGTTCNDQVATLPASVCLCGPGHCSLAPSRTQWLRSSDQAAEPLNRTGRMHKFPTTHCPISVGMQKFSAAHSPITAVSALPTNFPGISGSVSLCTSRARRVCWSTSKYDHIVRGTWAGHASKNGNNLQAVISSKAGVRAAQARRAGN